MLRRSPFRSSLPFAISLPLLGLVLLKLLPSQRTPIGEPAHIQRGIAHKDSEAIARAAAIGRLLEELPKKSLAEKLESAYDGAVRSHNIGFPTRREDEIAGGKEHNQQSKQ